MQLLVIKTCLIYSTHIRTPTKSINKIEITTEKDFKIHDPADKKEQESFGNWFSIWKYIFVLLMFSLIVCGVSLIFGFDDKIYINCLGVANACTEGFISLPQLYKNYKTKNTSNISIIMVLTWLSGDIFKSVYYVKTNMPLQLIICTFFQLSVNLSILGQIIFYNCKNKNKKIFKQFNNESYKIVKKDINLSDSKVEQNKNQVNLNISTTSTHDGGETMSSVIQIQSSSIRL